MNIDLKLIVLILIAGVAIFFAIEWHQASEDFKNENKVNTKLIKEQKDSILSGIKKDSIMNIKRNKVIDSLNWIIGATEIKRKSEFYRYEKEIGILKGIKTYTQHVGYLDSLDLFLSNH